MSKETQLSHSVLVIGAMVVVFVLTIAWVVISNSSNPGLLFGDSEIEGGTALNSVGVIGFPIEGLDQDDGVNTASTTQQSFSQIYIGLSLILFLFATLICLADAAIHRVQFPHRENSQLNMS